MRESVCNKCTNCIIEKGTCRGLMDCDPDEIYCYAGEEVNFLTPSGCYQFEEKGEE